MPSNITKSNVGMLHEASAGGLAVAYLVDCVAIGPSKSPRKAYDVRKSVG